MARPKGLEPLTLCSGGTRSNPTELRARGGEMITLIVLRFVVACMRKALLNSICPCGFGQMAT